LKLTIVGSGTILPDPDRGPCALLVEAAGLRVLVDGGSGTLRTLTRLGHDPRELDAQVLSHRHLDHVGELPSLLFLHKVAGRRRPFRLYGGGGLTTLIERIEAAFGELTADYGTPVTELSLRGPDAVELAPGLRLETAPAVHKHGALHLAFIADGRRVVFSGDTGPSPALAELSRGADLLVTECAYATPGEDHLCAAEIAAMVAEARPARVVLTHLYPEVDEATALATIAATGVPVERGFDGWSWEG